MARGTGGGVREGLGVEGETESGLDPRSEGLGVAEDKETGRVDLGLDEGGGVEVVLGSNLEVDLADGRLGVVDGPGSSLCREVNSVVVRGREGAEVAEGMDGGRVLGGGVADGGGVLGDGTGELVVGGLSSDEEAVSGDNGVSGDGGSLKKQNRRGQSSERRLQTAEWKTCLEEVNGTGSVDSRVLEDGTDDGALSVLGGVEGGDNVELESLSDDRVELGGRSKDVGGVPGLNGGRDEMTRFEEGW